MSISVCPPQQGVGRTALAFRLQLASFGLSFLRAIIGAGMAIYRHRPAAFALLLLFAAQASAAGQQPKFEDLPSRNQSPESGLYPGVLERAPLDAERRASVQEALKARDYTRAETILVSEINKHPASPELLTLAGGIFFLDGKYLNSAIAFKKADKICALDDRNRFTLALDYIILNHRDWARPELEKLAKSDPKNPLYPYWLGRLDYDAMQFTAAVERYRKALELDSTFMKAYDNLGLCYEALGKYDQAVQTYQQAIRLDRQVHPGSPWPALNLGSLLVKLDRLAEAEGYLRESLREDPKLPQAHYQLALLLEKQKKDKDALQELHEAATLNPAYAEPHYVLGRIYRKMGDSKNSQAEWAMFQKLKKEKPQERPH